MTGIEVNRFLLIPDPHHGVKKMHESFLCDELIFLPRSIPRPLKQKASRSFVASALAKSSSILFVRWRRFRWNFQWPTGAPWPLRSLGKFLLRGSKKPVGPNGPRAPSGNGSPQFVGAPLLSMHPILQIWWLDNPSAHAWRVRIPPIRGESPSQDKGPGNAPGKNPRGKGWAAPWVRKPWKRKENGCFYPVFSWEPGKHLTEGASFHNFIRKGFYFMTGFIGRIPHGQQRIP